MTTENPVTQLKEPEGAYILRLSKFPLGVSSAVQRIASGQAGIYAWYKSYEYPADYEGFCERLLGDSSSPKFPPREGDIKPYFRVTLSSSGAISVGKKNAILESIRSERFRSKLRATLSQMSLFQCPLYIGRSRDLRERIKQHLGEGSALRTRLSEHRISIEKTLILIIPSGDDADGDEAEEDLYEEIFSRLLNPLFNLRLG